MLSQKEHKKLYPFLYYFFMIYQNTSLAVRPNGISLLYTLD